MSQHYPIVVAGGWGFLADGWRSNAAKCGVISAWTGERLRLLSRDIAPIVSRAIWMSLHTAWEQPELGSNRFSSRFRSTF